MNEDIVTVGLRLRPEGFLIGSGHFGYSLVVEWLVWENFSKVWCGGVWICGAGAVFHHNTAIQQAVPLQLQQTAPVYLLLCSAIFSGLIC